MTNLHSYLVTIKSFLTKHFSSPIKVKLFCSLSALLKGFYGESFVLYNFENNNPKEYLSDYARLKTRFINVPYKIILKDKEVFKTVFGSYIDIPQNTGIIRRGKLQFYSEDYTIKNIINKIIDTSGVIIKPRAGSGGYNITHLRVNKAGIFLNNQSIDIPSLENFISRLDEYLITDFVEQGYYAKEIFSGSTNTIRVVTMISPKTNKPFIAAAVHRFGTSKTIPTDNWTQGGLSSNIDIETGILGKAVSYPEKTKLEWHSRHPETLARIEGVHVPNWKTIKEQILYVNCSLSSRQIEKQNRCAGLRN